MFKYGMVVLGLIFVLVAIGGGNETVVAIGLYGSIYCALLGVTLSEDFKLQTLQQQIASDTTPRSTPNPPMVEPKAKLLDLNQLKVEQSRVRMKYHTATDKTQKNEYSRQYHQIDKLIKEAENASRQDDNIPYPRPLR